MMSLYNSNFNGKIKHFLLFKIVIIIILIWIYDQNNVSSLGRYIEKKSNFDKTFNSRFNRLLAKHGTQVNGKYQRQGQDLFDGKMNKTIKENMPNYENLKKGVNDLDSYKKDYKRRHDKKKGLARLDCYCEKRIFDKIDYIYDLAKRLRNDKKTYKKYIHRKFVIRFIIFALLPFLGLIIPILFGGTAPKDRIVPWTTRECAYKTSTGPCRLGFIHFNNGEDKVIAYMNFIFFFVLAIIVLLTVIYIFIKIIKYERLKAGKSKMNIKEYCTLCKYVFDLKK